MPGILPREFYTRPAPEVAPALLGCRLVRVLDGVRLSGIIAETEAYQGEEDLACHARSGRTPRTETMYGEGGHAYIYFTYGMHWLLNAVTCPAGTPAAVLIRALLPLEGEELIRANRPNQCGTASWLNGPAKLVQALALDGRRGARAQGAVRARLSPLRPQAREEPQAALPRAHAGRGRLNREGPP